MVYLGFCVTAKMSDLKDYKVLEKYRSQNMSLGQIIHSAEKFSEKALKSAKEMNGATEQLFVEVAAGKIEPSENYCAALGFTMPDGSPIKGKEGVMLSDIIRESLSTGDRSKIQHLIKSSALAQT